MSILHGCDEQHIGAVCVEREPFPYVLAQHARSERAKALAVFHFEIKVLLHRRRTRVAEDRAVAERARTELHTPLHPTDRLLLSQRARRAIDHLDLREHAEARTGFVQPPLRLRLRKFRPEISALHGIAAAIDAARHSSKSMRSSQCGAQGPPGVAGGGLDPDLVEDALAVYLPVGDAIER